MVKGKLPWIDIKGTNVKEMIKAICKSKSTLFFNKFCENLPKEFVIYFEYVLKLAFFEKPDYSFLKGLFSKMMDDNGFKNDGLFDWISIDSQSKGINLSARRLTSKSPMIYMKKNGDSGTFDEFLQESI